MQPLKDFDIVERNGQKYVYFDKFLEYLRKHHTENDNLKEIKKFNVLRELQKHKNSPILEEEETIFVTILSVLRYIFNHVDDSHQCNKIAVEITSNLQNSPAIQTLGSHLDLYKAVAKFKIKGNFAKQILDEIDFDSFETSCLHDCYQDQFHETEWQQICLFEHHFYKFNYKADLSYECSLEQKWAFLKYLENCNAVAK